MGRLVSILVVLAMTSGLLAEGDYGPDDASPWISDALVWDAWPVDVSFLNHKPAGAHGFVVADGGNLRFEDGTPARFWGANVAASALFVEKPQLRIMARRIAAMGFNLVRIHHQDSMSWVNPTIIDATKPHSRDLNYDALDRLDYFIACLKEEGIYVYYDLHVGRVFKPGDGIDLYEEMASRRRDGKAFCYIDPEIQALMQEHNEKVLRHVNPYTGLAYADDPAFAAFLLTNENDVAHNGGNTFLADKGVPGYWERFRTGALAYAREHGLDPNAVLTTWVPSDAKIYLAHLETEFFQSMIDHLRGLGVRVPVVGTNWAYGGLFCMAGMVAGADMTGNHVYDGGPTYLTMDPRQRESFLMRVANAHVAGVPFAISEWNIVYEGREGRPGPTHRASASIGMAAMAAHQGWAMPMLYNYRQTGGGQPAWLSAYDTFLDPALMGAMPAAALLARRDVEESPNTTVLLANRQQVYHENWQSGGPGGMVALRTGIERSKTVVALETVPEGLSNPTIVPLDADLLPAGATSVTSDTGQITRDWSQGLQTIDTPGSQVAQGFYGGSVVELSTVRLAPRTPFAVIAVSSLTDQPIAASGQVLITAISQSRRPQHHRYTSQTVLGEVVVRFEHQPRQARLTPLMGDGQPGQPVNLPVADDGSVTVDLGVAATHWFLLETR